VQKLSSKLKLLLDMAGFSVAPAPKTASHEKYDPAYLPKSAGDTPSQPAAPKTSELPPKTHPAAARNSQSENFVSLKKNHADPTEGGSDLRCRRTNSTKYNQGRAAPNL
jgi:hypothetical protein